MRAFVRDQVIAIVLTPEEWEREGETCAAWEGHVFRAFRRGGALVLGHLGPHDETLAVPINVSSRHPDPAIRLISNFAPTPFVLHGRSYASIEGFWQGLRTASPDERARIATLGGREAKQAGAKLPAPTHVQVDNCRVVWASPEHWDLMREACRAKFAQHKAAREALLSTAPRPLVHRARTDSRSIPGAVMVSIWMGLRAEFALRSPERRQSRQTRPFSLRARP